MKIEVNIEKRYAYIIIGVLILVFGFLVVNAYGGTQPNVMGHSVGEIDGVCRTDGTDCLAEADPTVLASVKDGVIWSELGEIPDGFADGVDNVGGSVLGDWTSKSVNIVYQAITDGMVVCESSTSNTFAGYTDGSNPPTTVRTRNAYGSIGSGITMPVKKGDYWKVTASGSSYNIYWIPLGT